MLNSVCFIIRSSDCRVWTRLVFIDSCTDRELGLHDVDFHMDVRSSVADFCNQWLSRLTCGWVKMNSTANRPLNSDGTTPGQYTNSCNLDSHCIWQWTHFMLRLMMLVAIYWATWLTRHTRPCAHQWWDASTPVYVWHFPPDICLSYLALILTYQNHGS